METSRIVHWIALVGSLQVFCYWVLVALPPHTQPQCPTGWPGVISTGIPLHSACLSLFWVQDSSAYQVTQERESLFCNTPPPPPPWCRPLVPAYSVQRLLTFIQSLWWSVKPSMNLCLQPSFHKGSSSWTCSGFTLWGHLTCPAMPYIFRKLEVKTKHFLGGVFHNCDVYFLSHHLRGLIRSDCSLLVKMLIDHWVKVMTAWSCSCYIFLLACSV